MVEGATSGNNGSQVNGSICPKKQRLFYWNAGETSDAVSDLFDAETVINKKQCNQVSTSPTGVDCISLFELMQQIIMRNQDEHVRLEAVTIMSMIVMRSNAYSERVK